MKQSELTILIPSFSPEHHELTGRALSFCLESLKETFNGEVIVAYNGEKTPYPVGQCAATNRVAKEVKTEWIMVSNNDMTYPPGWFNLLKEAVDNWGLLCASPNLVEPRKGAPPFIEHFCGGVGTMDGPPDFDKQKFIKFVETYSEHENRPETVIEDGFNMPLFIRKDVWDTVGGYDEEYDPWGSNSDSDLQYKLMVAGVNPTRVRSALVYHFSNTSGTFHPDHRDAWEENWRYFTKKWGVERASSPEIWYRPSLEGITFKPEWKDKYANN